MAANQKTSVLQMTAPLLQKLRTTFKKLFKRVHEEAMRPVWNGYSRKETKAVVFLMNIKLDVTTLEQVNRFKHLGVTLKPPNGCTRNISNRPMLASTVLRQLHNNLQR